MNLSKYKYVSFDIFDTLIVRNVLNPEDVFEIVEKKYNEVNKNKVENFRNFRIEAAKIANKKNDSEETNINQIYDELCNYYDKDVCKKLYEIEIETEINICVRNENVIKKYYELVPKTSKIIIVSDMYLEEETIKKILKKNNIKYDKLYLSSTYKLRKSSGTIFAYIKNDLKVDSKDIIHIGDNFISDYIIPKVHGIKSILIKNNNFINNQYLCKREKSYEYKTLENFISNNINLEKDYYYKMGYETFGPILYGFVEHLEKLIPKDNKIFFFARDGYLISKAFNLISKRKGTYFYASRRAIIIPSLWMCNSLKEMVDKLYIRDYIKVGNLFKKLGLDEIDYKEIIESMGFSCEQNIKYEELFEKKFINLFNKLKDKIYKNSKKEYNILLDYMKQEDFIGNCSMIDIGWNGNMQMALENIIKKNKLNIKLDGYYVGILPESKNVKKIKMNGYLFDSNENEDIYICLKVINSIFESMFLAPHGSTKKYKVENKKILPVLYNYEYKEGIEKESYEKMQNGALQFINDFSSSDTKYLIGINPKILFSNMMKFAYEPSILDTEKFGDFKFLEDDIIYIAKPNTIKYYLFHPKTFYKDLYLSGWLIGFLKRLTKINIFYDILYKIAIKSYLKKRQEKLGDKVE